MSWTNKPTYDEFARGLAAWTKEQKAKRDKDEKKEKE